MWTHGIPIRIVYFGIGSKQFLLSCFVCEVTSCLISVFLSLKKWNKMDARPNLFSGKFTFICKRSVLLALVNPQTQEAAVVFDDLLSLAGANEKFIQAIRHYSMHSDEIVDRAEPSNRYIALCQVISHAVQ